MLVALIAIPIIAAVIVTVIVASFAGVLAAEIEEDDE